MFKLFNRISYGFSGKAYDLAVIGGGPGGKGSFIKDTSLLSRLPS